MKLITKVKKVRVRVRKWKRKKSGDEGCTGMEPPCSPEIWWSKDQSTLATWSTRAEGWNPRTRGASARSTSFFDNASAPIFLLLTLTLFFFSSLLTLSGFSHTTYIYTYITHTHTHIYIYIYTQWYSNSTMTPQHFPDIAVFTFVVLSVHFVKSCNTIYKIKLHEIKYASE